VGGVDLGRGTGLSGLADRAAAIDGRLEIDSRPGLGTIVRAGLPCPALAPGRGLGATASAPDE
jgi:signal transduction histidine kinase